MNRYLRDRMIGRYDYRRHSRDERNPYGSRGGYVTSGRGRDSAMEYDYNKNDYYRNDYDYNHSEEYRVNGRDYDHFDYGKMEDSYKADLSKWIMKLKKHDRFRLSKDELLEKAKKMGISFEDYDEEEFIATYYMLLSDFPMLANECNTYLVMAKAWLEDNDIEVTPSEKLCIYFYKIVKGEE